MAAGACGRSGGSTVRGKRGPYGGDTAGAAIIDGWYMFIGYMGAMPGRAGCMHGMGVARAPAIVAGGRRRRWRCLDVSTPAPASCSGLESRKKRDLRSHQEDQREAVT